MRPSAAALEPYDPAFSQVRVNLSANENTYGMQPEVKAAVDKGLRDAVTNRYPQPLSNELRSELARWHDVGEDHVIVGNGGDELLFNLFLAFGGRELVETTVVDVPRDPETFECDADALVEAASRASIVVVTSPNNPTGNLFPIEQTRRLCEACPGVVLLDEAYMEFAPEGSSAEPLLAEYDNLAVLHTLSKAFCLAGGRIGYVLASPSVVNALAAVRQPYSVNVFSQAAGLAAVRNRKAFEPTIANIASERERLLDELASMEDLGVTVWPSAANFLLVRMPDAHVVRDRLRDEFSILVRDFSSASGLRDCLRVTVGMPDENDALLEALRQLLKGE